MSYFTATRRRLCLYLEIDKEIAPRGSRATPCFDRCKGKRSYKSLGNLSWYSNLGTRSTRSRNGLRRVEGKRGGKARGLKMPVTNRKISLTNGDCGGPWPSLRAAGNKPRVKREKLLTLSVRIPSPFRAAAATLRFIACSAANTRWLFIEYGKLT